MAGKELTPEELAVIVAEDRRRREQEFMKVMDEAAQRLRVVVEAVIESHGATAVARVVVRAE